MQNQRRRSNTQTSPNTSTKSTLRTIFVIPSVSISQSKATRTVKPRTQTSTRWETTSARSTTPRATGTTPARAKKSNRRARLTSPIRCKSRQRSKTLAWTEFASQNTTGNTPWLFEWCRQLLSVKISFPCVRTCSTLTPCTRRRTRTRRRKRRRRRWLAITFLITEGLSSRTRWNDQWRCIQWERIAWNPSQVNAVYFLLLFFVVLCPKMQLHLFLMTFFLGGDFVVASKKYSHQKNSLNVLLC